MNLFLHTPVLLFLLLSGFQSATAQTATPDNFFVFVGERISMDPIKPKAGEIPRDRGYTAKYKVDTSIYGNYANDTIEFEVYIHLGDSPAFSSYQHVLLYLTQENGKWYHEKYQFNAVYRTKNGRWAGTGRSDDYDHTFNAQTTLKPENIVFGDSVWIDMTGMDAFSRSHFENDYYLIESKRAYPVAGNYVEDLFALKKTGVLKARGLF
jgi:hypothetical protein